MSVTFTLFRGRPLGHYYYKDVAQKIAHLYVNEWVIEWINFWGFRMDSKIKGWGTLCIKEHFTSRNTLLPKSWTHFAAQHTLQSHNLLLSTLCIVTFCSKEQFPSYWLVTVCFLTHFATQELNTLCSPTHFAKSQFTPQHTLVINTLCHSEPFTPHYTLLLNTLCHSEPFTPHYTLLLNTLCLPALFASWSTLLPNTFCSMNRNGNNPIYPLG